MAESQINFQSYRVVWTIEKPHPFHISSAKFKIGNSNGTLQIQHYWSAGCRFALCGPMLDLNHFLRSSYYLLSTVINKKLENKNLFLTRLIDLGITDEVVLVCAFDVACAASGQNSEEWIEVCNQKIDPNWREELNMFKKMIKDRIYEIAGKIKEFSSDTLLSEENVEFPTIVPLHLTNVQNLIQSQITDTGAASTQHTSECNSINHLSQAEKNLSESVQSCFKEKLFCDIAIKVLNGSHVIRAHKIVLFSGSTYWKQILTNDMNFPS